MSGGDVNRRAVTQRDVIMACLNDSPVTERHICLNKFKEQLRDSEFAHLRHLEVKVGVLSSGYLVLVDVGVARLHGCRAVEWRVQSSGHLPVLAVVEDFIQHDACSSANTQPSFISSPLQCRGYANVKGASDYES